MSADHVEHAVARREGLTISRDRPGGRATTRMRKAECGTCGYTIRVSRRWIARGLPDCPACRLPLECRDLDDAMADPAQDERLSAAFADVELAGEKRARTSQRSGMQARCKACSAFMRNPHAQCSACGFQEGAGYLPLPGGGRFDAADEMPF